MFEYKFLSTSGDMNGWYFEPAPHSNWPQLLQGNDSRVPKELAEVLWGWYFEAMYQVGELVAPLEEDATEASYAKVVNEVNWITKRFEKLFAGHEMPAPPENLMPSERWLSARATNREWFGIAIGAYCIWCIDCCISALFEGNALVAVKACACAGDALRVSENQCVALGKSPSTGLTLSQNAKAGANKAHIENRRMKAEVFEWLDANMQNFKSMDSAAETISQRIAPVKFRTARDWVAAWKKLRSASKP